MKETFVIKDIPVPQKKNHYRIRFDPRFWKLIAPIVALFKGRRYWIDTDSKLKESEEKIARTARMSLKETYGGRTCATILLSGKSDIDALSTILDGLEKSGRLTNDRLVVELHAYKTDSPHTTVTLEHLDNATTPQKESSQEEGRQEKEDHQETLHTGQSISAKEYQETWGRKR